jgi:hypothetical protein
MFERLSQIFEPQSVKKERIGKILSDLRQVGPQKPLGYLPIETLVKICKVSPESIEKELHEKGLKTLRLKDKETNIVGGALYAYDEIALQELLTIHQELLEKEGWPSENEPFIKHLVVHADQKTDLFNLIADAFNDQSNPSRK